jgi:hypothetical protein
MHVHVLINIKWIPINIDFTSNLAQKRVFWCSPPVVSGVRVTRSLVFCVMFCRSLFVLFLLAIVLSVLRFTDSDYPFGVFKLFLIWISVCRLMPSDKYFMHI